MKDHKLRAFLGVMDLYGMSVPSKVNGVTPGILAHLRERIESIERYLDIKYESSPSSVGYPKHVPKKGPENEAR